MPVVTVFDSPRRTDGDRLIADVELAGVAERDRREAGGILELDDREVVRRVGPDDGGLVDLAVGGRHGELRVGRLAVQSHDVRVGDDVAVRR
jgi:hypothetical protein